MNKKSISIMEAVKNRLTSPYFKEAYRSQGIFFCRNRTLNFVTVTLLILNNISKSLGVEVTKFLQKFFGYGQDASKQAFSKARYKLKPEAFIDLNDTFIQAYYSAGGFRLYREKYLLLASDGSDYELPWEQELREVFGVADNGQGERPLCMAKGVKIWDVLNQLTVASKLGSYNTAEIRIFDEVWQKALKLLREVQQARLLLLGDMHYPSFPLMIDLVEAEADFLFRCPPTFCREVAAFMKSQEQEATLHIILAADSFRKSRMKRVHGRVAPQELCVRGVRIVRPDGQETCLLTSVSASDLDAASIGALYCCRWGEEVSFNFDKNRVEIENFSAKLPQGIQQEYYASTLFTNLTQLIVEDAQELLEEEQRSKANKHQYQINRSIAAGLIKDEIPKMLFGKEKPVTFYKRMITLILKHREPIRPGRIYPRKRKHKLRFSMNSRRVV